LRYSCGHVSTKKNVRGIKDAATSTPPQLRSSRYIRYRDNIGYPRYGERYDIGDNQYSSNNLSYCPINRFLESIMNLTHRSQKLNGKPPAPAPIRAHSICRLLSAQGRLVKGKPGHTSDLTPSAAPTNINELQKESRAHPPRQGPHAGSQDNINCKLVLPQLN
jgi:hypothetical protein